MGDSIVGLRRLTIESKQAWGQRSRNEDMRESILLVGSVTRTPVCGS